MGRRREAATIVCGGESSPSSAETSFRVLDDVLLQTKTKIWLSQVLKRRLEEDVHISDLLADGELLFEVSKLLWDMLLVKFADIRNVKANPCSPLSRRRGGRYMPYSNVDSFLKVCKVLGLNGIDLFSPSDVVEKRDIRKVCICIRALSKKARSQQLNVPDFDGVSYAAAMPKNMVGYIRRSIETSQCSTSSYSSQSSCQVKRSNTRQKRRISDYDENSDSDSNKSDEAESKYLALEAERSRETNFGNPQNLALSDSILGPDGSNPTLFDEEETMWIFLNSIDCDQSDLNQITFKNSYNGKRLDDMDDVEVSSTMSMNSIVGRVLNMDFDDSFDVGEGSSVTGRSTELLEYENDFHDTSSLGDNQPQDFPYSGTLSNCSDADDAKESQSEMELEHERFWLELLSAYRNQERPRDEKTKILANDKEIEEQVSGNLPSELHPPDLIQNLNGDIATISPHLETLVESVIACTDSSVEEGQSCPDTGEVTQDTTCGKHGSMPSNPDQDVVSLASESVIACTDSLVEGGQSCPDPGEVIQDTTCEKHGSMPSNPDQDVGSLASESVIACTDSLVEGGQSCPDLGEVIQDTTCEKHGSMPSNPDQDVGSLASESVIACTDSSVEGGQSCPDLGEVIQDTTCEKHGSMVSNPDQDVGSLSTECDCVPENPPNSLAEASGDTFEALGVACGDDPTDIAIHPINETDGGDQEHPENLAENIIMDGVTLKDQINERQEAKPRKRRVVKNVVKGTALIGVLCFLLHISRRGQEKTKEVAKQSRGSVKSGTGKPSSREEVNVRGNGAYPAEKLKFGM